MKLSWRDVLTTLLVASGAVVVFAKLQAYSWWLIGSWKGALGVLIGIGAVVLGTYIVDWFNNDTLAPLGEMTLWLIAATISIGSLFVTTTKAEFVSSAVFMALAWLAQLSAHTWDTAHDRGHTSHTAHAH